MADVYQTALANQRAAAAGPSSVRGERAGESFKTTAEMNDERDRDAFRREKGWGGIAGAAKAPRGQEFERQFAEWRKAKAANSGQQKALNETK